MAKAIQAPKRTIPSRRWAVGLVLSLVLGCSGSLFATGPAIAVLYGSAWSPGDTARDGAAELEVLLCVARVCHENPLAGIVGVGSQRGSFPPAAEAALERVARMGVPVVRLAQNGPLPAHEGDVFIEAGGLSATEAKHLLTECLVRYGPLPVAADPASPTPKESLVLQTKIALFQRQFDVRNSARVAMR